MRISLISLFNWEFPYFPYLGTLLKGLSVCRRGSLENAVHCRCCYFFFTRSIYPFAVAS